ncbi:hypothetical protein A1Q2_01515 [Trichosporon asahii var. asahii CBS 8904]|uniref:Uncharacterized protein n=1 Tax=Trichosporon asahii var. asahii (strain CBS 8904) TaxID=1220162 RepID=K1WTH0_TRIAC|nr:hypothetical protein A1Q2_01515 [Trichosporon asahii var. asahii CBS 8904]
MSFSNPLNVALLIPIAYLVFRAIVPQKPVPEVPPTTYTAGVYNWGPDKHPEVGIWKEYTPIELAESDGIKSKRILLAIAKMDKDHNIIERTVFDVSKGANFYGPAREITEQAPMRRQAAA